MRTTFVILSVLAVIALAVWAWLGLEKEGKVPDWFGTSTLTEQNKKTTTITPLPATQAVAADTSNANSALASDMIRLMYKVEGLESRVYALEHSEFA